ncbi:xanthine/CO dehydrogenase XdhC/CoxF family maturation factor [Paraburkholderia atlantica]
MMDSVNLEVLRACQRWLCAGHRVLLVTVVKTWGSSPYVGALGSRRNNAARRERLREFDLSNAELARLHAADCPSAA